MLRSLLGIARVLRRDVILPRMLCYCDFMWKEMKNCRVGGAESMRLPFDCPMDHVLDTPRFFETDLGGVGVREPKFLDNPRVPPNVSGSVAKVSLPKGLNDAEVARALAPYARAGVIEIEDAVGVFCGFAEPSADAAFAASSRRVLEYRRTPFCMMEGSDNAPLFSQARDAPEMRSRCDLDAPRSHTRRAAPLAVLPPAQARRQVLPVHRRV